MAVVDLNADVGEWEGEQPQADRDLLTIITSANVACGLHAGNDAAMAATVALARFHGVEVGAHPSLDDRANFGRRETPITSESARSLVAGQVTKLAAIAAGHGIRLHHVKPHGALYNMAARDRHLAEGVAAAVLSVDPHLVLVGLAGSELIAAGQRAGLRTASEVFADRAYARDGSLAARNTPGAVITDAGEVAERAVRMVVDRCVVASDGTRVPVAPDTICVHGDTPGAAVLARLVRRALERAGVQISACR